MSQKSINISADYKSVQILGGGIITVQNGGGGGGANLAYTASSTQGVVTSDTGTDATIPAGSATNASLMLPADKTKLDSVASGATANATDAQLRDRTTHTGSQAISTVTGLQTALDGKQATGDYATNTALTNGLATKENTITAGTVSQYYRGDKTFQTLDKTAVGLANVDNTSDLNKPISTATQTALNAKQNTITNSDSITQGTTNLFLTTAERTKLTNTTGTNSGDNAVNTLYSGLVSNATHTGDVTGATTLTIANNAVTYAKIQNVTATDKLLGRSTAGAGIVEEITCTSAGRSLIAGVDASAQKTTLGLGNVDNTSDVNKPISTATQTALNAKQDTLVSGVNIKTINSQTLLGSGDIVISGGSSETATILRKLVRNQTGATIPKGTPVYQLGSSGIVMTVATADASLEATASQTLGITQEAIANNANGYVVAVGLLDGINTSALTEGQIVWLSETAGGLTTTRPTQPAHGVVMGYCVKQGGGASGILYVKVDNGLELEKLHDVLLTGAVTGNVLALFADGLWKPLGLTKSSVGLSNVDNTSDANKPVSTATQTALNAKENTITAGTTAQYYRGDKSFQTLDKSAVGLANVDNTSDANKPISTATQTALNAKQNTITTGTTAQYFRGDLSLATLDKTAVGLSNVDNTSDANKPVSTATQTALNAKENTLNADQKRKVTISSSAPTGGSDGDIWLQYTP